MEGFWKEKRNVDLIYWHTHLWWKGAFWFLVLWTIQIQQHKLLKWTAHELVSQISFFQTYLYQKRFFEQALLSILIEIVLALFYSTFIGKKSNSTKILQAQLITCEQYSTRHTLNNKKGGVGGGEVSSIPYVKISVTSPIVTQMPTRELLAGEIKSSFV